MGSLVPRSSGTEFRVGPSPSPHSMKKLENAVGPAKKREEHMDSYLCKRICAKGNTNFLAEI